jgi:hypothetical protein
MTQSDESVTWVEWEPGMDPHHPRMNGEPPSPDSVRLRKKENAKFAYREAVVRIADALERIAYELEHRFQ